jgi:pSer/pThr/pTyr-binding forkhead associated (FHA) protein
LKLKNLIMKKIIVTALAAVSLAACNDNTGTDATVNTTDSVSSTTETTGSSMGTTDTGTTSSTTTTTTSTTYTPGEGDVTYRDKKVRVWRNGQWVDSDNDVNLDNGVVVRRNGRVTRNGKEVEMQLKKQEIKLKMP